MFNHEESVTAEEPWPFTDRCDIIICICDFRDFHVCFCSGIFRRCFQPVWPRTWKQGEKDFFTSIKPSSLAQETRNYEIVFSSSLAQVWFANEFVSVVCKTPISSNFLLENPQDPSTTRITCHLPPRMGSQGSDWFNLILKVGDERCNCELEAMQIRNIVRTP